MAKTLHTILSLTGALLIVITINEACAKSDGPIVELPEGKIQGHILESHRKTSYYAFQQIPYAAPPVGTLRFKDPQSPGKWDDVLDVTSNTLICYQKDRSDDIPKGVQESEDCLYLNVYTPLELNSEATPLPVLVWIHGGYFYSGDGTFQSYSPEYLVDYDVVVVTLNYRLGPLGFLTTTDGVISANLGLKDQNFALKWVNKNIKLFGGDPEKITIGGENTGAASVGYHIVSEQSKGLFRSGIMQSGTVLCASSYQDNAQYFAYEMGRALNSTFTSEDSKELLKLLQNADATEINEAVISIPEEMVVGLGVRELIWLPIIENVNFSGAFVLRPMHEDIKSGNINRVPVLLGFNSEEELPFVGDGESLLELGFAMDRNFSYVVKNKYNMTLGNKQIAGRALRQVYTKGLFQQNLDALVKFMSDEAYTTPVIRHAELQAEYKDVYLYQFSHKGMLGDLNVTLEGTDEVGHGEDLNYIWASDKFTSKNFPLSDKITQHRILKLWTNFVKYLDPTPDGDNALLGDIKWPKVTTTTISYLNINRTLEVKTDPRAYKDVKEIIERYATTPLVTF